MKELVIYPAFAVIFLGLAMQLVDIAESSSEKTLLFAEDMEKAIDCATKGIDISVCSPNLVNYENYDFSSEINKTVEVNNEIIRRMQNFEAPVE